MGRSNFGKVLDGQFDFAAKSKNTEQATPGVRLTAASLAAGIFMNMAVIAVPIAVHPEHGLLETTPDPITQN